jgi:hypothetical protein
VALGLTPSVPRRSSPWFILAVVVTVLVVAMVFFAVYAEHLIHAHGAGLPPGPTLAPLGHALAPLVSALRS